MPTLELNEGFESGSLTGYTTSGTAPVIDATAAIHGTHGLHITATGASQAKYLGQPAGTTLSVGRFYFKVNTLPASGAVPSLYVVHTATAKTLQFRVSLSGVVSALITAGTAVNGPTVSGAGIHYIDYRFNVSAATFTCDWQVDGVAQTQATGAQAATTIDQESAGNANASIAGLDYAFDDWAVSRVSADYPIGQVVALNKTGVVNGPQLYTGGSDKTNTSSYMATYPWTNICGIGQAWKNLEATRGTFDWAGTGTTAAYQDAYTKKYAILLRINTGCWSPAHIYTTGAVPTAVTAATVAQSVPIGTKCPVWWSTQYKAELSRLADAINTFLSNTNADGSKYADYTVGVVVMAATWGSAEAWYDNYPGSTQAAWDSGTSTTESQRQGFITTAWANAIDDWITRITNKCGARIIMALGGWMHDGEGLTNALAPNGNGGAYALCDPNQLNKFGGVNAGKVIGMHTDWRAQGTDANPTTWESNYPKNGANLRAIRAAGGLIGMQGYDWPWPGFSNYDATVQWSMEQDMLVNWADLQYYEPGLGLLGQDATIQAEMQNVVQPALAQPTGNEPDFAEAAITFTPSATEVQLGVDSTQAQLAFTPSATVETAQRVDSTQAQLVFSPTAVETTQRTDAATAQLTLTTSFFGNYFPLDTAVALLNYTPSALTTFQGVDTSTALLTALATTAELAAFVDAALAALTLTAISTVELKGVPNTDTATALFNTTASSIETKIIADALLATLLLTASGIDLPQQDQTLVPYTLTPGGFEEVFISDLFTARLTFTPSAAISTVGALDSATAFLTFTPRATVEVKFFLDYLIVLLTYYARYSGQTGSRHLSATTKQHFIEGLREARWSATSWGRGPVG